VPVFQSPGIASGIDVNTLVTKLVDAERAPAQIRLDRSDSKIKTQVSALGQLKGSWSALLASLAKLKTEAAFQIHKAESSDKDAFTATATETATPGSYGIEILAVASAPKLTSGLIAGGSTAVIGTGDLTIAVGSASFTVTIDGTNNTLAGIRDAINAAADNKGVRATIINTTGGAVLTLSGANTGAANALRVTRTGGDGGLDALVYDPGVLTMIGFATRHLGRVDEALGYYDKALALNPNMTDTRQYLGEAYLLTNNLEKAKDQFRDLERLCPRGCEQLDMLKAKIEEFQKKAASN